MGRKGFIFIVVFMLGAGILSGCAMTEKTKGNNALENYYVAEKEETELKSPRNDSWTFLGAQFATDEVVSLWGAAYPEGEFMSVYLVHEDGRDEKLVEKTKTIGDYTWYRAGDGTFYVLDGKYLIKVSPDGEEVFRAGLSQGMIRDMCVMENGSVFLLAYLDDGTMKLAQLNSETGDIIAKNNVVLKEDASQFISTKGQKLLLSDKEGIYEIALQDGSRSELLSFENTGYAMKYPIADFEVSDNGELRVISERRLESIRFVDMAETRTIIKVRNNHFMADMPQYVAQFNKQNEKYYVVLEERDENTPLEDFREKTMIEIGTGGGADIIMQDALLDVSSLLEKGAFEDLQPYLQKSGLKEEEFFPAAFGFWKDGDRIYGANMLAYSKGIWISKDLLGNNEAPDINVLVDALMNYKETAVFKKAWESNQVLEYLLAGSENLWGMVDWERGTCDFGGEQFAQMLEVSRRYGYDEKNSYPALAEFRNERFYTFEYAEELAVENKVYVGYIYEDGCYPAINQTGVMAINSNSDKAHKEGAWEFIEFLLSEEIQSTISIGTYPVRRSAFETIASREIREGSLVIKTENGVSAGRNYKAGITDFEELGYDVEAYKRLHDLNEKQVQEIRDMLNSARPLPTRTETIKAIIREEAEEYFAGQKGYDEVISVIENRVRLYLEENFL